MASIIDRALAKSLIKEYRNQNAAQGGPGIITPKEDFLNGYVIDRKSLEDILSNPNFTGVSIHLAKHPDFAGSKKNHFTVIFAGAQPNATIASDAVAQPNTAVASDVAPYSNPGDLYEFSEFCPPYCSDID
jgi:hypothetical protein